MYEQYYANLAAATSANNSASATPTFTGRSGSSPPGTVTDAALFEEEEDRKPAVEYLDSLNAYRKRSRSQEDVGGGDRGKIPRKDTNGHTNGIGGSFGPVTAAAEFQQDYHLVDGGEESAPVDDPLVMGTFPCHCLADPTYVYSSERSTQAIFTSNGGGPRADDAGGVHRIFRGYASTVGILVYIVTLITRNVVILRTR